MKKVKILVILVLALMAGSCSKDNNNNNTSIVPADFGYIPFYPGNYWVYEQYKIDTLGNETLLDTYDSVAITGTKNVAGITYLVFEGTWPMGQNNSDTVLLLADSIGYYVDPTGWIHFSESNFVDTLASSTYVVNGDTLYESCYKMQNGPQSVTVPAGTFYVLTYLGTIHISNPAPYVPEVRYKDKLYARNVGLVRDTYYYLSSPDRYERRLKKYYVDRRSSIH